MTGLPLFIRCERKWEKARLRAERCELLAGTAVPAGRLRRSRRYDATDWLHGVYALISLIGLSALGYYGLSLLVEPFDCDCTGGDVRNKVGWGGGNFLKNPSLKIKNSPIPSQQPP